MLKYALGFCSYAVYASVHDTIFAFVIDDKSGVPVYLFIPSIDKLLITYKYCICPCSASAYIFCATLVPVSNIAIVELSTSTFFASPLFTLKLCSVSLNKTFNVPSAFIVVSVFSVPTVLSSSSCKSTAVTFSPSLFIEAET